MDKTKYVALMSKLIGQTSRMNTDVTITYITKVMEEMHSVKKYVNKLAHDLGTVKQKINTPIT